jgi:hypothetical protein
MNELPLLEGISIQVDGSVQTAIDRAGASYRRKFGRAPTHVSLPGWIQPDAAMLFGGALAIGRPTSASDVRPTRHRGTVIVGRPVGTEGPTRQLELFGEVR